MVKSVTLLASPWGLSKHENRDLCIAIVFGMFGLGMSINHLPCFDSSGLIVNQLNTQQNAGYLYGISGYKET